MGTRLIIAGFALTTLFVYQNCGENLPGRSASQTGTTNLPSETLPEGYNSTPVTDQTQTTNSPQQTPPRDTGTTERPTFTTTGTVTPYPARLSGSINLTIVVVSHYNAGSGIIRISIVGTQGEIVLSRDGATTSLNSNMQVAQSFSIQANEIGLGDFRVSVSIIAADGKTSLFTADNLVAMQVVNN